MYVRETKARVVSASFRPCRAFQMNQHVVFGFHACVSSVLQALRFLLLVAALGYLACMDGPA